MEKFLKFLYLKVFSKTRYYHLPVLLGLLSGFAIIYEFVTASASHRDFEFRSNPLDYVTIAGFILNSTSVNITVLLDLYVFKSPFTASDIPLFASLVILQQSVYLYFFKRYSGKRPAYGRIALVYALSFIASLPFAPLYLLAYCVGWGW